jgi:hypothetical protein
MGTFKDDFGWQRRFMPEVKRICGEYLISESPYEEDCQRNTDLIVLRLDNIRIGCRIRRFEYADNYHAEFTIRSSRPNNKTELAKIVEGWGDYFFYGFSDANQAELACWFLGDLNVFRLWFSGQIIKMGGIMPGIPKENHDGSSDFRVFRIDDLPTSFVVGQKRYQPIQEVIPF